MSIEVDSPGKQSGSLASFGYCRASLVQGGKLCPKISVLL